MTAQFIAEAERAAAEAVARVYAEAYPGAAPSRGGFYPYAGAAVAAVVPILAEHFAQAVEARIEATRGFWVNESADMASQVALAHAAYVIREAATPTEGGTR